MPCFAYASRACLVGPSGGINIRTRFRNPFTHDHPICYTRRSVRLKYITFRCRRICNNLFRNGVRCHTIASVTTYMYTPIHTHTVTHNCTTTCVPQPRVPYGHTHMCTTAQPIHSLVHARTQPHTYARLASRRHRFEASSDNHYHWFPTVYAQSNTRMSLQTASSVQVPSARDLLFTIPVRHHHAAMQLRQGDAHAGDGRFIRR